MQSVQHASGVLQHTGQPSAASPLHEKTHELTLVKNTLSDTWNVALGHMFGLLKCLEHCWVACFAYEQM